jgi:hypothetical protein
MFMSILRFSSVVLLCAVGASPAALGAQVSPTGPQVSLTGPHWRVVSGHQFSTVVAYDTTRIKPLPSGRFDLWQRYTLKPPRVDPDGVVGTIVLEVVIDCAARQSALRLAARYNKAGVLIKQTALFSAGENDFSDEPPGSVEESALQEICRQLAVSHPHP